MNRIIWLASYPKSGNTWFRVFLTNLRGNLKTPADINELETIPIASGRVLFDDEVGIESSDLTGDEIDRLRPEVYEQLAANSEETLYIKVHDAYTLVNDDYPLFPQKATSGVIYIIRNPLDVAASFAHHLGKDYDTVISRMGDANFTISNGEGLHSQLRQKLLTWSGHAKSWTEQSSIPVCILRYEDMKRKPLETFEKAVRFLGLNYGKDEILKALEMSSFEELQRQENENGFKEKSPNMKVFFRKGEVGAWREELVDTQVLKIIKDQRDIMQRFGYLGEDDHIVF